MKKQTLLSILTLVVLCFVSSAISSAQTTPGSLDYTFGTGGAATTYIPTTQGNLFAGKGAVQSDGKILALWDAHLIRFPVRNYAIAESQALITNSKEVIELRAFSEKLANPLLTNSLNSANPFGSYSESQSFNSFQNRSIGFSSGAYAGKKINTIFSRTCNFSVVCEEALSISIRCKLSSSSRLNSSINSCIVSVSKSGNSSIKLLPVNGSIIPNK